MIVNSKYTLKEQLVLFAATIAAALIPIVPLLLIGK